MGGGLEGVTMQYLGGKSRISKPIAEILSAATRERERERVFVSLFCGSCVIEAKVDAEIKLLNDKHPYLIAMWKALQEGWVPPQIITDDEYYRVKANMNENPALAGFVGFGCSFGGKWWGGMARNKKGQNYCANASHSLLRDLQGVQKAIFTCLDYRDVIIPDNAVVYCDPPYVNTTTYTTGKFNTDEFWDYMRQLSKRCDVYISEQSAPNDFECIWQQEVTRVLDYNKSNSFKKVEKLFKYNGEK